LKPNSNQVFGNTCSVDLQQFEIVGIGLRREAEIEQIAARLTTAMRLDVQRQSPFAAQGAALRGIRHARALDGETGGFRRAQKDVVVTVGDLPHDDLIDGGHVDPHRRGSRRPGEAGQQHCATDRRRAVQEGPPVHLYLPLC